MNVAVRSAAITALEKTAPKTTSLLAFPPVKGGGAEVVTGALVVDSGALTGDVSAVGNGLITVGGAVVGTDVIVGMKVTDSEGWEGCGPPLIDGFVGDNVGPAGSIVSVITTPFHQDRGGALRRAIHWSPATRLL